MKNILFFGLLGYQILSFLLFLYGPINYNNNSPYGGELFLIFSLYTLSIVLGYFFSGFSFSSHTLESKLIRSKSKFVLYGVLIGLFFILIDIFNVVKDSGWAVIINPGEAYLLNLQREKSSGIITQLSTLNSAIIYFSYCCGFWYLKEIKKTTKILLGIFVICYIFSFLLKGVNFGVFYMLLSFIVIHCFRGGWETIKDLLIVFILFVYIFFYAISSRMKLQGIPYSIFGIKVDEENVLIKIFPEFLAAPLVVAISYISQGYYALHLAIEMKHEWTFGLGGGRFIMDNLGKIFDVNVWESTYQYRMDAIWDAGINWHTAYVWMANDWGIYGVLFPLFFLGAFFNLVLRDAQNGNIFAITLLPIYVLIFLFLPANNILFGNPSVFMPFFLLMFIWFFSRKWKMRFK